MELKNKTILIISPQPWSNMFVSKHHYAIELMRRGNTVFFLQPQSIIPPSTKKDFPNLYILSSPKFFGDFLRFHYRPLYKIILSIHLKKLAQKIKTPIDVVFNFDNTGKYTDISMFNSTKNIFFPVDQINIKHLKEYQTNVDVFFSITPLILDTFKSLSTKKVLLNHGLGHDWEIKAKEKPKEPTTNSNINIGYFGNFCFGKGLDMDTLKKVISLNQHLNFHFWGNFSINRYSSEEIKNWISFLEKSENVKLYGAISPKELIENIEFIDVFLLCYNYQHEINKCSNSHKILEYLSTGKVIVANKMSMYSDNKELMNMLTEFDNDSYIKLFNDTITNLTQYNSKEIQKKRKEFTLENTYAKQVDRIQCHLTKTTV